ncbi:Olfactory Receptor 1J1 [Manis pentadactyla]|nr:Olfactory Receptor 1J1 [Manis pentadactyla]
MGRENQSSVSEFLLLGLPFPPEQQGVLFALFLGMYLTTVLGNLLIILLVRLDSRLHTPMYFLLSHLALSDVSFASIAVPKMLTNTQRQCRSITYSGCISQVYFFVFFGSLDSFLLTVMAYDSEALCLKDCYTLSEIHDLNQRHDSLKGHQMNSYDINEICSWALPEGVITPTSGLNTIDDIRLSWIHPCM